MNAAEYIYMYIVHVIPKGLAGPTRQSFFAYDNDKDLKAHFPMARLNINTALNIITTGVYSTCHFKVTLLYLSDVSYEAKYEIN